MELTKSFDDLSCVYRVWDASPRISVLHGYAFTIDITLSVADDYGSFDPFDFSRYQELKQLLVKQFDHTLLVASTDPLLEVFQVLAAKGAADLRIVDDPSPRGSARWVFRASSKIVRQQFGDGVRVVRVVVREGSKNSVTLQEDLERGRP